MRKNVQARTVTLKLKTADFRIITRSLTYSSALPDAAALAQAAAALMKKVPPSADDAYRLIGIGVGICCPAASSNRCGRKPLKRPSESSISSAAKTVYNQSVFHFWAFEYAAGFYSQRL